MKPVYVFKGHFKKQTVQQTRTKREAATRKWKEAVRRGQPALKYAQQAARIDADIVESSKELLDLRLPRESGGVVPRGGGQSARGPRSPHSAMG